MSTGLTHLSTELLLATFSGPLSHDYEPMFGTEPLSGNDCDISLTRVYWPSMVSLTVGLGIVATLTAGSGA